MWSGSSDPSLSVSFSEMIRGRAATLPAEPPDYRLVESFRRFLGILPDIANPDDLALETVAVSGLAGLRTVMAGVILFMGESQVARFHFGNWPPEWMERYTDELFASDPLVSEARKRIAPFTWTDLEADCELSPGMVAAIAAARASGWQGGYAVPIHGPGGYLGLVSFAGAAIDLTGMDRALLQALAYAAHAKGRALASATEGDRQNPGRLTPREIQVMRWVASGKSDWAISQILGIAESTVHFHVEQAKRKLKVRSRVQAVGHLLLNGHM